MTTMANDDHRHKSSTFWWSCRSDSGSFRSFRMTLKLSESWLVSSSRKKASCCWPTTRVLPANTKSRSRISTRKVQTISIRQWNLSGGNNWHIAAINPGATEKQSIARLKHRLSASYPNNAARTLELDTNLGRWRPDSPNHRRSGTMRVLGSSLDWKSFLSTFPARSLLGRVLYILSRRTVAADRLPPPAPPPAPFLSLGRLTSFECRGLPDTFTAFSFFFAISFSLVYLVISWVREWEGKGGWRRVEGGGGKEETMLAS